MKKTIYAVIIAALMFCSIFAALRTGTVTAIANGMAMDPTIKTVNPPEGGSDLTFLYNINITTTVTDVTGWEARLFWDPGVLRPLAVVWGTFMTGGATINKATWSTSQITLGQTFSEQVLGITGSGLLAQINFTFVLPGKTFVKFLEANVTDDNLVNYNLLAGSSSGRVETSMPYPGFWWWTNDDANNPGSADPVVGLAHGEGPLPSVPLTYGDRSIPDLGTTVYFTANFSYSNTLVLWNATSGTYYLSGSQPEGIGTVVWNYGDGVTETYTGGNFTQVTTHQYTSYNKTGWLVTLTVYTGVGATGNYWSSAWRYQGPVSDDTVPMWEDVAIVDIWPSLVPFQDWDTKTGYTDWYAPWWYDSTDYFIPSVSDNYWNYNISATAGQAWGLPGADLRLWPTYGAYAYHSYVKTTDTDVGLNLVKISTLVPSALHFYMYWDKDASASYSKNDVVVLVDNSSGTRITGSIHFNSTLGDVAYNNVTAMTDGVALTAFTSWVRFYDTNANGAYNTGEPFYYDYYPRGVVAGDQTTVNQAYAAIGDTYDGEGPGLNVLVTANNFGSITEVCTVNLYAIGVALKVSGTGWTGASPYTPVETVDCEQIGQWAGVTIGPGAGTGWNLGTNWLPTKNMVYVLFATIETAQSEAMNDQDLTNNYMMCPHALTNIAMWNSTALALVTPGWVISEYLNDPKNTGTVGSANLGFVLTNWMKGTNPFASNPHIPKSP